MHSHFLESVGERYGNFVVTKHKMIHEIQALLREITHLPTGAKIMDISNDDPENLFCLSFQTLPYSSNGIAHILEHTVLCGSKHFPVKDPFFAMSRRSLNTFMNALTGSDFTCYPAASQVEKDFYNLLTVYLDAVFSPNLTKESFLQEGHRFEFVDPKDPATPLTSKGIVFNEMKGSMASIDTRLWHTLMEKLLPDLPYAFNSGGDPKEIPSLTHEELLSFHKTYYHPSRCLFFFYGSLPLKQHLDFLEKNAFKGVSPLPSLPPIPKQTRFTHPVTHTMHYPIGKVDDPEKETMYAFCYLTARSTDQEEVLALTVLDHVLMDSDASLLKKELLASDLCIQADAYMDSEMSEVPYAIICKGCPKDSADLLEKKLRETLLSIAKKGIPFELIEAAIHQLEFSRLEITGDHSPFGLTLFMRAALAKQQGGEPEHPLMIHSLFESLLKKMSDPHYVASLIEKHFLSNPHLVRLILHPDPDLASKETQEELCALEETKKHLSPEEIQAILHTTQRLEAYQKQIEAQSLDCLPKVSLEDVPPIARDFALKESKHPQLTFFHHPCFTNHILYADLQMDLPQIEEQDLCYAHLLLSLLPEIGSGSRSYEENLHYIQAHTGGIHASFSLNIQTDDPKVAFPSLILRGKALDRKIPHLFSLFYDTCTAPRFGEEKRIHELLQQISSNMKQRLSKQGMRYAIQLALSPFSEATHISEAWQGLRYFQFIQNLRQNLKTDIKKISTHLFELHQKLFSSHNPHLILSCSKEQSDIIKQAEGFELSSLPQKPFTPWTGGYSLHKVPSQGRIIPSPVAFSAVAVQTVSYLHPFAPALMLATFILENKYLHPQIREQGGAYGCGATYTPQTGHFYLHSFRDPHIAQTKETFHRSIEAVALQKFTERDLEEAKIGVIQQLDTPVSPAHKAATAYSWLRTGKKQQMRQHFRDALLSLKSKDIAHAVGEEILPRLDKSVFVTCADRPLLEKENRKLKEPLLIKEI